MIRSYSHESSGITYESISARINRLKFANQSSSNFRAYGLPKS